MTTKPVKPKKCKAPSCWNKFIPRSSTQVVCSPLCASRKVAHDKERKAAKEKTEARREYMEAKVAMLTLSGWIKKTQQAFNEMRRLEDADLPCISCGRTHVEWTVGGSWDCGHYLSVGSHPELRFEPLNAHKQCKSCNGGSGKYARKNHTVAQSYRINLIARIGNERVEWLEGKHEAKHYTIDDLKELHTQFKQRTKELKKMKNY